MFDYIVNIIKKVKKFSIESGKMFLDVFFSISIYYDSK